MSGIVALGVSLGIANAATDEVLARTDGDLIGRLHFAGTARLAADPYAAKLNEIGALPPTAELREKTLQKLATTPFRLFQQKLANGNTNDYSRLIHPLLDDLLREESYMEMRGPSNAVPELMLAVHLSNDRAKAWHDNLAMVLASWTGIPVKEIKGDGFTGWELRKHHDPNVIRCLRAGDWVLFGWGENELRLQPGFLQRIKETKRPVETFKGDWLDAMMDWPTFMKYHPFTLPAPLPAKLPKMHLTVQTEKNYLRPKLTMQFPEPLGLKLEPWSIPTKLIQNSPSSFTAVRGIGPWLSQFDIVRKCQPSSVPNQLTIWSMAKVPFETCVAAPVSGATNYLAQIAPRLVPVLNSTLTNRAIASEVIWTNNQLYVVNMPFIGPYLRPIREPAGDFLLGGLFPTVKRTNSAPFPPALLHEIQSKPNLVYYGWENNEERLPQWGSLSQIYLITSAMQLPPAEAAGFKWLQAAKSKLGNCFTEVTLTAPDELTLVRNAPIGLTGLEMTALEYWVDSPEFPLHARYPRGLMSRALKPTGSR
ncbi:MAG: hypothetical protein JWQ04_2565 [Pedosphaera sp.]|nr:hypothetical protein [Pedosphaera sp.]